MELSILTQEGIFFVLRWLHFFFGILWIGHLYYFNFTQGTFMAGADAPTKSAVTRGLVPQALYWFRWGAMWTFVTGWLIIMMRGHRDGMMIYSTSWGVSILLGALLGSFMWFNVWFVIWPNQKQIIASAVAVAGGGAANPNVAALAARATVASRTNTLFSIPLLFFMGAASHLPMAVSMSANLVLLWIVLAVIVGALEFNALKGKAGPMTTVKGVIGCGFGLAAVLYIVMELLTK